MARVCGEIPRQCHPRGGLQEGGERRKGALDTPRRSGGGGVKRRPRFARRRQQGWSWPSCEIPTGWTVFEVPSTPGCLVTVRLNFCGSDEAASSSSQGWQPEAVVVRRLRTRRASITWPAKGAYGRGASVPEPCLHKCRNCSRLRQGLPRARVRSGCDPSRGGWQCGGAACDQGRAADEELHCHIGLTNSMPEGTGECLLVVVRVGTRRTDGMNCGALQQKGQSPTGGQTVDDVKNCLVNS